MDFITIASVIGLSSIISATMGLIFGHIEKKKMLQYEKVTLEKQRRYQATLSFMLVMLDSKNLGHVDLSGVAANITKSMADEEISTYFIEEVEAHYSFSHLYASDSVLTAIRDFLDRPSKETYQKVALAMRNDLWK